MKVSVVVPTRNNSKDLINCIKSLKKQSTKIYETIIVSPNNDSVISLAKKLGCKWFEDDLNTIGNAYHIGSIRAKGDIVAFIDDDCTASKDWLSNLVNEFKNDDIDVVGGDDIIDADKSTKFQNALFMIDFVRTPKNTLYGNDACNRLRACNIAFRSNIFKESNFNRKLVGLQEPEFIHRLFKNGFNIKFNPDIKVYHSRRKNLGGVFNQIYRNGISKIDLIKMHKDMITPYDIIIFGSVIVTIILLLVSITNTFPLFIWVILIVLYFILKPFYILLRVKNLGYYPVLFTIVFVREIAYATGLIVGLLKSKR